MKRILLAVAALVGIATPAHATNQIALDNDVFVERVTIDASGKSRVTLEAPKVVVPGDRLVFVLNYRNASAKSAERFVLTNPLPAAVRFDGANDANSIVSIDGGKNWGALERLAITEKDGTTRAAQPSDVTHVRWAFAQPIPAGASGKLMFRGIVK